jgi:hypothetical protein
LKASTGSDARFNQPLVLGGVLKIKARFVGPICSLGYRWGAVKCPNTAVALGAEDSPHRLWSSASMVKPAIDSVPQIGLLGKLKLTQCAPIPALARIGVFLWLELCRCAGKTLPLPGLGIDTR